MPVRHSEAIWEGTLKNGHGKMSIGDSGLEFDYSYPSRFDTGTGTNPEELLGAAHAGCFSMALSMSIGEAGYTQNHIRTRASVHLEKSEDGYAISRIQLSTTADVPGMDEEEFIKQAEKAKAGCPVSRALADVDISLKAKLERGGAAFEKPSADAPRKKVMPVS